MDFEHYAGREQSFVKHCILRQYLQRLAYKVGSFCDTIRYVDGFAGPWHAHATDLADTSPRIAIQELQDAREGIAAQRQRRPRIECLFIEKGKQASRELRERLQDVKGVGVTVLQGEFEKLICDVIAFARKDFTFFFIDPKGWTGYGMSVIRPLLRHDPGEVLINFNTGDILRFVEDDTPALKETFADLYGDDGYQEALLGLDGLDREDAAVAAYCERVKTVGGFRHVVSAPIFHRTDRRTRYHLVYATRHLEGLRTFREAEQKALPQQVRARASAQQQKRLERNDQGELFEAVAFGDGGYCEERRERYHRAARSSILRLLSERASVLYDDLVETALFTPMVCESHLKQWIRQWQQQGCLHVEGLAPGERVPKLCRGHSIGRTNAAG